MIFYYDIVYHDEDVYEIPNALNTVILHLVIMLDVLLQIIFYEYSDYDCAYYFPFCAHDHDHDHDRDRDHHGDEGDLWFYVYDSHCYYPYLHQSPPHQHLFRYYYEYQATIA